MLVTCVPLVDSFFSLFDQQNYREPQNGDSFIPLNLAWDCHSWRLYTKLCSTEHSLQHCCTKVHFLCNTASSWTDLQCNDSETPCFHAADSSGLFIHPLPGIAPAETQDRVLRSRELALSWSARLARECWCCINSRTWCSNYYWDAAQIISAGSVMNTVTNWHSQ